MKEKILHSNRYYNHLDLHFSIEIYIQFFSYELSSKISNRTKFTIVAQQLIITYRFENIIENIIQEIQFYSHRILEFAKSLSSFFLFINNQT